MADKTGYIGRNPNDSAVTVARQFFTASGVTTTFTFASGYLTGFLDVYVDGVKRRVADEFTATDGSTFDVLQGGVSAGSTVEAVAYKAFNAAAISGDVTGNFDVSGNTTLGGSLSVTGGTTLTNLNVTGIATLGAGTTVAFANTAFNLGGTPDITIASLSAVDINVSGAATIGGILTYEDVTNIDSLGIVTARTGVEVTANGLVVNAGVSTFAADVSVADKIVHTGDANTAIRFPSADTITAETAGSERLRISSGGDVTLAGIATVFGATGIVSATSFDGNLTGNVTGNVTGNISGGTVAGSTGTFSDVVEIGGDANNGTAEGIELNTSGFLQLSRGSGVSALLAGYTQGSSTQTVRINNDGSATFKGDLTIADKIIHDGDTNTAIRFPADDTFTVETGGTERLRITSAGVVVVGHTAATTSGASNNSNFNIVGNIGSATGEGQLNLWKRTAPSADNVLGQINFCGDTTGDPGAVIKGEAELDWDQGGDTSDHPSRLTFFTVPDNSSVATERLRITSAGNVRVPDNGKFTCGADDDLKIYSTGSVNYLAGDDVRVVNNAVSETMAKFIADGAVELYHNDIKRLETSAAGVTVTGTLNATTAVTQNGNSLATNGKAIAMALIFG